MGGGSCARGPSGDGLVGREKRDATRACTPSLATDCRYSSRFALVDRCSRWNTPNEQKCLLI